MPILKGDVPYLAFMPWDIDRWRNSDAYEELSLAQQGAYLNLCFRAWQEQPDCRLPNDDDRLWRMARAGSKREWMRVRDAVLKRWEMSADGLWITHPVVLDTYAESRSHHDRAVESGRRAGKASARARRNLNKVNNGPQRPFNGRSTSVNPPSPLPLPSPNTTNDPPTPPQAGGVALPPPVTPSDRAERHRQERRAAWEEREHRVEQARQFALDCGIPIGTYGLRRFRRWFLKGATLGEVQQAIEEREHLVGRDGCRPWIEVSRRLGSEEQAIADSSSDPLDVELPSEEAQPPPAASKDDDGPPF